MSYYRTLGLEREPFSNSPDPDLLYRSKTHLECLQHMEIAVRLRRGLNVVLGEVGTGKTTLCRELQRVLAEDPNLETYLLDDPYFPGETEFLLALGRLFGLEVEGMARDQGLLKAAIKNALSLRGGDGRRIVTLLVDEGQKITGECLELLRELLNFETNTHKLLQIVIFAQKEFDEVLVARPNLDDRINFRYELRPLDFHHTSRLIRARLNLCAPGGRSPELFTRLALRRIYRVTGGYPRKIVRLCHLSMLLCVGLGRSRVTWGLVGRAAREGRGYESRGGAWSLAATGLGLAAFLAVTGFGLRAMYLTSGPGGTAPVAAVAVTATASGLPNLQLPAHAAETGPSGEMNLSSSHADPVAGSIRPDVRLAAAKSTPALTAPSVVAEDADLPPVVSAQASAPQVVAGVLTSAGASPSVVPMPEAPAASRGVDRDAEITEIAMAPGGAVAPERARAFGEATDQSAPENLGSAVTKFGWTVSQQAVWLYGQSTRQVMAQLAKANPGIAFDRIRAGQSVTFPAIRTDALPPGHCLVKLAEFPRLETGFAFLAEHKAVSLPLTLYVTFRPDAGLRYEVVAAQIYPDADAARAALAGLPPDLAATARLVDGYPEGTVFYSDVAAQMLKRAAAKPAVPAARARQVASRETHE